MLGQAGNQKVRVKWYRIAALMLLFAVFALFLMFRAMDEMQQKMVAVLEQELSQTGLDEVLEAVEQEVQTLAEHKKILLAVVTAGFLLVGVLILMGMNRQIVGTFSDSVERLHRDASAFLADIREGVLGVLHQTGKIDLHMKGLSRGMKEVAHASDELSYYMEGTAAETERLCGLCEEQRAAAGTMEAKAHEGEKLAEKMRDGAGSAKREAYTCKEAAVMRVEEQRISLMRELKDIESAEQILGLTVPMMGILEQINLLSLSAGMEASKMGEEGRKYSGAAEEIRVLVEQARGAMEKIRWAGSKSGTAAGSLKQDVPQMFQLIDQELLTGFDRYMQMADLYGVDAKEMGAWIADFDEMVKELAVCVEKMISLSGGIGTKLRAGGVAGTKGMAEKARLASEKMEAMTKAFGEANGSVRALEEKLGRLISQEEAK